MRVPWRVRLAEKKSAGFSPPSLDALFVTLGGENSCLVRRPRGAMRKRARGGDSKCKGRGASGA
eukprot:3929428-Pleurochrysis_carterae.AAC.1